MVYLYPSLESANGKAPGGGGTGFIVSTPLEDEDLLANGGHHYVVTNDHVRVGAKAIRINLKDGGSECLPIREDEWFPHPDGDDLAIRPLILEDHHRFAAVNRSMILSTELQTKYDFGPGDEAFLVGRYVDLEGRSRNIPTVRTGVISVFPAEPILQSARGHRQDTILVEGRSLSGYSGSPVFATLAPSIQGTIDGTPFINGLIGSPCVLLGVVYGHHPWRHTIKGLPTAVGQVHGDESQPYVEGNSGMMMVIPHEKILSLLDTPELVDQRLTREETLRRVRRAAKGGD